MLASFLSIGSRAQNAQGCLLLNAASPAVGRRRAARPSVERSNEVRRRRIAEALRDLLERNARRTQEQEGPLAALLVEKSREGHALRGQLPLERARRDAHAGRDLVQRAEDLTVRDGLSNALDEVPLVAELVERSLALFANQPQGGGVGLHERHIKVSGVEDHPADRVTERHLGSKVAESAEVGWLRDGQLGVIPFEILSRQHATDLADADDEAEERDVAAAAEVRVLFDEQRRDAPLDVQAQADGRRERRRESDEELERLAQRRGAHRREPEVPVDRHPLLQPEVEAQRRFAGELARVLDERAERLEIGR